MGTRSGSPIVVTSDFGSYPINGAGTAPEVLTRSGPPDAAENLSAIGGVWAAPQLVATGKGGAVYGLSLVDINRLLPKAVKGVFRAKQAWAELYVSSGLIPGLNGLQAVAGMCCPRAPLVLARAGFEFASDKPAAIDFSGRVTVKDGPLLASVWTVVVQALGSFEPRNSKALPLGGRLTVVATLPVRLVVRASA